MENKLQKLLMDLKLSLNLSGILKQTPGNKQLQNNCVIIGCKNETYVL